MIEKEYDKVKLFFKSSPIVDPIENSLKSQYIATNPIGDWVGMAYSLYLMMNKFKDVDECKIAEIGTAYGQFIYSMANFIRKFRKVKAFGVDSKLHRYSPQYFNDDYMNFVEGKSDDQSVLNVLGNEFHFIFIDACHCQNHVYNDLKIYYDKIVKGGFIALHDTLPEFQGGSPQIKTPECSEDLTIGVVKGISRFNMRSHGFQLVMEDQPQDIHYGGIRCYEKVT